MKVSSKSLSAKTLNNRLKKDAIVLKHKLQRLEDQWSTQRKSLLIDSLLREYLVN